MAAKMQKTVMTGHTAGIFADMTLDGPEIGTLVAVIDRAKNLPNRKTMGKQNPYCAMRLGKEAKKTETDRRGGQTPKWDQELRFTVHESPDYYKLKCSVFNDDKRTDLIGEAWINLSDLIKPGGGSNDLWHQLNYKGKYAGDIRIELTYYDLRPKEEKLSEKRKQRDKTQVMNQESTNTMSAPRQLGPRDVRRRPLPTSPAPAKPAINALIDMSSTAEAMYGEPPALPPKIPHDQHRNSYTQPELQQREEELQIFNSYAEDLSSAQTHVQHYRQPFCEEQSPTADYQEDSFWDNGYDKQMEYTHTSSRSSMVPSPSSLPISSWSEENDVGEQNQRGLCQQYMTSDGEYRAPLRALPSLPAASSEPQYHSSKTDPQLVRPVPYRDNSLRQSISQQSMAMQMVGEPESYSASPPPPPMHRETPPRKQYSEYPPSSFPQHGRNSNVGPRRLSIEDRSPLQHIEHDYDPHRGPDLELQGILDQRYGLQPYQDEQAHRRPQPNVRQYDSPSRHSSYDVHKTQELSQSNNSCCSQGNQHKSFSQEPVHQRHIYPGRSSSYEERRSSWNPESMDHGHAVIPYSISQPDLPQTSLCKPQFIHSRPSSSHSGHIPQRKAVSPGLYPSSKERRLGSVPYGPDAYDVLNPASSPVTNNGTIFQTASQAREAARMKEVEKLRDQGPIIGNDGRVIDPSDHLPSDTWAPEPERKQRRPEHIIHYRTKNDARPRISASTSSTSTRTSYGRQTQSPSAQGSPPASNHRDRIQKPPPPRPLPTQPYSQPIPERRREQLDDHSVTANATTKRAVQRYSYQDQQSASYRPQLSEYQISVHSHTPRDSSYGVCHTSTPPQAQMRTGRNYNSQMSSAYDDPLIAEMNMIDIGPSRTGQMVLSNRRGY